MTTPVPSTPPSVQYQNFPYNEDAGLGRVGAAFFPINESGKWTCADEVFGNPVYGDDIIYYFDLVAMNLGYYQYIGAGQGWSMMFFDEAGDPDFTEIESFELNPYDIVWYAPNDAVATMNVAGQVADTSKTATWSCENGIELAQIMNPFPIATKLSDFETFMQPDDMVYVMDEMATNLAYFQYNGKGVNWTELFFDEGGNPDFREAPSSTVVLEPGQAGWFTPADVDTSARVWEVKLGK